MVHISWEPWWDILVLPVKFGFIWQQRNTISSPWTGLWTVSAVWEWVRGYKGTEKQLRGNPSAWFLPYSMHSGKLEANKCRSSFLPNTVNTWKAVFWSETQSSRRKIPPLWRGNTERYCLAEWYFNLSKAKKFGFPRLNEQNTIFSRLLASVGQAVNIYTTKCSPGRSIIFNTGFCDLGRCILCKYQHQEKSWEDCSKLDLLKLHGREDNKQRSCCPDSGEHELGEKPAPQFF